MSSNSSAPIIKNASSSSETEEPLIDQYRKLSERCDFIISKIKNRKDQTKKV